MVKGQKINIIRNPKSSSGSVELHSEQVGSSQEIINSDDIRRDDEDYQNEGEVLNSNTEQNYEENEDDKYNDKIISIDEYTFGKNKKKKLEIETAVFNIIFVFYFCFNAVFAFNAHIFH